MTQAHARFVISWPPLLGGVFSDDPVWLCAPDRSPGGRTDERPKYCGASRRAGITMSLSADDLLGQAVHSANYANGVWHLLTEYPEMKQCGPEMGGMQ